MKNRIQNIIEWADQRGILNLSAESQFLKLIEEVGEIAKAIVENNRTKLMDGIGDSIITLINLCKIDNQIECTEILHDLDEYAKKRRTDKSNVSILMEALDFAEARVYKASFIALYEIAYNNELCPIECIDYAFDQIKNRQGVCTETGFVKNIHII